MCINNKMNYFIICDYLHNRMIIHKMWSPLLFFFLDAPYRFLVPLPRIEAAEAWVLTTEPQESPCSHYYKTRKLNGVIN